MTIYELSRKIFDWSFTNPEKITGNHIALYFFCIEHCNRLGWKDKFGLPTSMAKEAIGINSYKTYIKCLNDLVDWGFIKVIEKSKNQYSSNIIALVKNTKATTKALDKALLKHGTKQVQLIDSIDIQDNNIQDNKDTIGEIVSYLNICLNTKYSPETKVTAQFIKARLKEGRTIGDFKKVIDIKTKEWSGNPSMETYLRPETLFGNKFESYLNQQKSSTATQEKVKPEF